MKTKLFNLILIFFSTTLLIIKVKAQDIIIKNDKSEIKSKVIELTSTTIKYKKWENQDGPLYNIENKEVFMILYANGQREIIKQSNMVIDASVNNHSVTKSNINSVQTQETNYKKDTIIDFKNTKLKYKPTRLNFGLSPNFSIGPEYEYRIIKNILNFGAGYNYIFSNDKSISNDMNGIVYLGYYVSINRLMKNYEKQDEGLFPFIHLGLIYSSFKYTDFYGNTQSIGAFDFGSSIGADYFFPSFTISISTLNFNYLRVGIVFDI